jgi:hypothetical protein
MTGLCNYQKSSQQVFRIEIRFVLYGAELYRLESEKKFNKILTLTFSFSEIRNRSGS